MDQIGNTPLITAVEQRRVRVVEYLVEHFADLEAKNNVRDTVIDMKLHNC